MMARRRRGLSSLHPDRERHHHRATRATLRPVAHQRPALVEEIAAPVGGLRLLFDGVRERHLDHLVGVSGGDLVRPIAEGAAEAVDADVGAQPFEHPAHRHAADRPRTTREDVFVDAECRHRFEHLHRCVRQRHPVLLAGLHALGRDDPDPFGEIELRPLGPEHLAGAARRQDQKFERPGRDPLLGPQRFHECADVAVGQRRVMLDRPHLAARREQVLKVALPARRVLALAVAARCRPVEHGLDASPHARGRLGLGQPDRLQHFQHQRRVNLHDGKLAEGRIGVVGERLAPLGRLPGITPARGLRRDALLGGLLEEHRLGGGEHPLEALGLTGRDPVLAVEECDPAFEGPLPGVGEPDRAHWSEPVIVELAVAAKAEDPRSGTAFADHEVQSAAIVVAPRAQPRNVAHSEPSYAFCHAMSPAILQSQVSPGVTGLPRGRFSRWLAESLDILGLTGECRVNDCGDHTALSRIKWLFVIARNSSFTYKGRSVDIKQVGQELGVRYVLEGSVRKAGRRIRITGQLIDAASGSHLWADRFDGSLEDIFELQDKVASSVAGVIEPTLQAAEMRRSSDRPTNDLTAYDLYLRALAPIRSGEWEKERYLRIKTGTLVRDARQLLPGRRSGTSQSPALYRISRAHFEGGRQLPAGREGVLDRRNGLQADGHRAAGAGHPETGREGKAGLARTGG